MQNLHEILDNGERENIEFKEFLSRDVHLTTDRKQNLACQMNHRLLVGNGTSLYVIGIADDGTLEFKFNSYYVYEGQKFVFREGHSKGIGRVIGA